MTGDQAFLQRSNERCATPEPTLRAGEEARNLGLDQTRDWRRSTTLAGAGIAAECAAIAGGPVRELRGRGPIRTAAPGTAKISGNVRGQGDRANDRPGGNKPT